VTRSTFGTSHRRGHSHGRTLFLRKGRHLVVGVLAGLFLQACVTSPEEPVIIEDIDVAIAERELLLEALDVFTVRGKLGFWNDDQNVTASVTWREEEAGRAIQVSGPFGIGRVRYSEADGLARIERGDTVTNVGVDGGLLLAQTLGLAAPVPLEAISQWIRGLPGPDATSVARDERGRLEQLQWIDDGGLRWRARVPRYRSVDELDLPSLVTAESDQGNLRLALSRWELELSPVGKPDPDLEPPASGGGRLVIPGT